MIADSNKSNRELFREVYRWTLAVIGAAILVFIAPKFSGIFIDWRFYALAAATGLFSFLTLTRFSKTSQGFLSFSDVFIFIALFNIGKEAAILMSIIEIMALVPKTEKRGFIKYAYPIGAVTVRAFLAATLVENLFGEVTAIAHSEAVDKIFLAGLVFGLSSFLLHSVLALTPNLFVLSRQEFKYVAQSQLWGGLTFFAGAIFSALYFSFVHHSTIFALGIFSLVLFIFYATYSNYLKTFYALENSEARFRGSFDYAPIGMAIVSIGGDWLKTNENLNKILQADESEILNQSYRNFIHKEDLEEVGGKVMSVKTDVVPAIQTECRFINKSGESVWVSLAASKYHSLEKNSAQLIFQIQDIRSRKKAEEQLFYDARHDLLTGLDNRLSFMTKLEQIVKGEKTYENSLFAVLFIDLDNFKIINDTLGHDVGDKVLKLAAERFLECVHGNDTVARLGGDEFTILTVNLTDVSQPIQIAQRIKQKFAKPFLIDGQEHFVRMSIGIALSADSAKSTFEIMREADAAMYEAKSLGKNCYSVFDDELTVNNERILQLVNDLSKAIENSELIIHYQPIYDLTIDKIVGFEALLRWQHPIYGLLSPTEFIPLAEKYGMINKLDNYVLYEACRQLKMWQTDYPEHKNLVVSVNISPVHFSKDGLAELIISVLEKTDLTPESLMIEVTETATIRNLEETSKILKELCNLGIGIALDDFGTGYSSLNYLRKLPISTVKIDGSFIQPIENSIKDREILESIITMISKMEIKIIAENIETKNQISLLREMNCNFGEGFYLSHPLEAPQALKHLLLSDKPDDVSADFEDSQPKLRLVGNSPQS